MKRSSYINLNKILVKLDFRKLEMKLEDDIKEIFEMLIRNNTEVADTLYHYYATLIIRKIVLLYEISSESPVFDHLLEVNKRKLKKN